MDTSMRINQLPYYKAIIITLALGSVASMAQTEWNDDAPALISDVRARNVGDVLTIIIQEDKSTSKNTQTKASKASNINAGIESLFFSPTASSLLTKKGQAPCPRR